MEAIIRKICVHVVTVRKQTLKQLDHSIITANGGPLHWTAQETAAPPADGHLRQPKIAVPLFGYKNHSFARRYRVTHAGAHDGGQLGAVLDRGNTASYVWADTAARRKPFLLLDRRGLKPGFQRKKLRGRKMPAHIARNATRAPVRSRVEHVFAAQKMPFSADPAHRLNGPRPGQNRLGQSHPQFHPAGLAHGANCAEVT